MRIAIMGAGGVGSYFGARLAAAGEDIAFICRGAHLTALCERGMTVSSPQGDLTLPPVQATDDPATVGPVDVILSTVKLYDLDAACERMAPMVGPDTMIVPVQNGVTAADIICKHFDRARVVGGLVFIASFVTSPGTVVHKSMVHKITLGELDGGLSDRVTAFRNVGNAAGIEVEAAEDIERALWEKLVLLGAFGPLSAMTRQSVGPIIADPDLHAMYRRGMEEVVAVARARGIDLPDAIVDDTLALSGRFGPDSKSSMLEDLEAGKPLELEWITGALARMGREAAVPVPFNEVAYVALKPFANGTRG